jgi:hypothetical protein
MEISVMITSGFKSRAAAKRASPLVTLATMSNSEASRPSTRSVNAGKSSAAGFELSFLRWMKPRHFDRQVTVAILTGATYTCGPRGKTDTRIIHG